MAQATVHVDGEALTELRKAIVEREGTLYGLLRKEASRALAERAAQIRADARGAR